MSLKAYINEHGHGLKMKAAAGCTMVASGVATLGGVIADTTTDAVASINAIIPLFVTLMILSAVFGLLGGLKFGRK